MAHCSVCKKPYARIHTPESVHYCPMCAVAEIARLRAALAACREEALVLARHRLGCFENAEESNKSYVFARRVVAAEGRERYNGPMGIFEDYGNAAEGGEKEEG